MNSSEPKSISSRPAPTLDSTCKAFYFSHTFCDKGQRSLPCMPPFVILRYDHMSEVFRKMLDARAPPNTVDFLEELSLNIKRYRFGPPRDLIRDSFYLSPPLVDDAAYVLDTWRVRTFPPINQFQFNFHLTFVSLCSKMPSGQEPNLRRGNSSQPATEDFQILCASSTTWSTSTLDFHERKCSDWPWLFVNLI